MAETEFALCDENDVVINKIVADQAFIDVLAQRIADPNVNTDGLEFAKAYDVTGKNVGVGHKRSTNGKWVAPTPTPDEVAAQEAAQAAADQRAADDAFIAEMKAKTDGGDSLTQDETNRLLAIDLSRRPA